MRVERAIVLHCCRLPLRRPFLLPRFVPLSLGLGLVFGLPACGGQSDEREDAETAGRGESRAVEETPAGGPGRMDSPTGGPAGGGATPGDPPEWGPGPGALGDPSGFPSDGSEESSPDPSVTGGGETQGAPGLGERETDPSLGFSFQPPAPFQRATDDFVASARQALGNSGGAGGDYFTLPRMIFAVPGTDARIFVGEFPVDNQADDPAGWMAGYLEAARAKAGNAEFTTRRVSVATGEGLLIRIESQSFRNDRVLFTTRRGERMQIDYLIPGVAVVELEGLIAASIGSIETF